jgi:hypothetical protein
VVDGVRSSSGTIKYTIQTLAWLKASPASGMADKNGVTIRLTVNEGAHFDTRKMQAENGLPEDQRKP